jgi:YhcN/YlaJ family sporulation lipoprotein
MYIPVFAAVHLNEYYNTFLKPGGVENITTPLFWGDIQMKKWLSCIVAIAFISGCGLNNEANDENIRQQQNIHVKNSTIQNVDRKTGQEVSRHLVDLATSFPNVKDATAVVLGNYAIVGIDVKENLDRSEVGATKYSVAESLKNDPYGANAIVVADPDITARLREIQEDIKNGEPFQGIINELADISGRLMPEVPADIVDPNTNKKQTEKPNKQLNNKEENKLRQQQKKQSNQKMD